MTLLSVKFLFVREGVATDDGITEKTRGKGRGREGGIDYILKNYKGLISYLDPPDCNCNCNWNRFAVIKAKRFVKWIRYERFVLF